jgi:hypothetical protein
MWVFIGYLMVLSSLLELDIFSYYLKFSLPIRNKTSFLDVAVWWDAVHLMSLDADETQLQPKYSRIVLSLVISNFP